eukprot:GHVU01131049.1.p1 GENE.GHVU01131049.1~~GHVU01131049.1.p1  ORF type:complete len:166 (-),score=25.70 GHVU01131049.1:438-935(-)
MYSGGRTRASAGSCVFTFISQILPVHPLPFWPLVVGCSCAVCVSVGGDAVRAERFVARVYYFHISVCVVCYCYSEEWKKDEEEEKEEKEEKKEGGVYTTPISVGEAAGDGIAAAPGRNATDTTTTVEARNGSTTADTTTAGINIRTTGDLIPADATAANIDSEVQ